MKSLFIALSLFTAFSNANAATVADVESVKHQIEPVLSALKSVNGVGRTVCVPGTSQRPPELGPFPVEPCIEVLFSDASSLQNAQAAFKFPLEIEGVFIRFTFAGVVRPQHQ